MKAPGLAIVLGSAKKSDREPEGDEAEGADDEALSAAADAAFDALKDDDREGFIEAFKAALKAC